MDNPPHIPPRKTPPGKIPDSTPGKTPNQTPAKGKDGNLPSRTVKWADIENKQRLSKNYTSSASDSSFTTKSLDSRSGSTVAKRRGIGTFDDPIIGEVPSKEFLQNLQCPIEINDEIYNIHQGQDGKYYALPESEELSTLESKPSNDENAFLDNNIDTISSAAPLDQTNFGKLLKEGDLLHEQCAAQCKAIAENPDRATLDKLPGKQFFEHCTLTSRTLKDNPHLVTQEKLDETAHHAKICQKLGYNIEEIENNLIIAATAYAKRDSNFNLELYVAQLKQNDLNLQETANENLEHSIHTNVISLDSHALPHFTSPSASHITIDKTELSQKYFSDKQQLEKLFRFYDKVRQENIRQETVSNEKVRTNVESSIDRKGALIELQKKTKNDIESLAIMAARDPNLPNNELIVQALNYNKENGAGVYAKAFFHTLVTDADNDPKQAPSWVEYVVNHIKDQEKVKDPATIVGVLQQLISGSKTVQRIMQDAFAENVGKKIDSGKNVIRKTRRGIQSLDGEAVKVARKNIDRPPA